jgi:hypothetical protein
LSEFLQTVVRDRVQRRRHQQEFVRHGLASLENAKLTDAYMDADAALAKLERKLADALMLQSDLDLAECPRSVIGHGIKSAPISLKMAATEQWPKMRQAVVFASQPGPTPIVAKTFTRVLQNRVVLPPIDCRPLCPPTP